MFDSQRQIHVTATFADYVQTAKTITDDEFLALKIGGCLMQETKVKDDEIFNLKLGKLEAEKVKDAETKVKDVEIFNLKLGKLEAEKVKDAEIFSLKLELQKNVTDLTSCKTLLLKARGTLNLRGAWECYERERSALKMKNSGADRREIWEELFETDKFDHCFQTGTKSSKVTKVVATYAKLSTFVHSPDLDVVIIEKSKFDEEEVCFIQTMLKDLAVQYETWELGVLREKYPTGP